MIVYGIRRTIRLCDRLYDAAQIHPNIRYAKDNIVYRYYYDDKINNYLFPDDDEIKEEIKNIPDNLHKSIIPFLTCLSIATVFSGSLIKIGSTQSINDSYQLLQKLEAILGRMDDLLVLNVSGLILLAIIIILLIVLKKIGINTSAKNSRG